MSIVVINKYKDKGGLYIGRGSVLGNPFTREEYSHSDCILYHKIYMCHMFFRSKKMKELIKELSEKEEEYKLSCFCKPKACHGDFIKTLCDDYDQIKDMDLIDILERYKVSKAKVRMPNIAIDLSSKQTPIELVNDENFDINLSSAVSAPMLAYIIHYESFSYKKRFLALLSLAVVNGESSNVCRNALKELYIGDEVEKLSLNVYTRSSFKLGRMLSNMARIRVVHPIHGMFQTIEGYWYWIATGKKKEHDKLRSMTGHEAKAYGSKLERVPNKDFDDEIREILYLKIQQNPFIKEMLLEEKRFLVHFYSYGGKRVHPKSSKFIDILSDVCDKIKREENSFNR